MGNALFDMRPAAEIHPHAARCPASGGCSRCRCDPCIRPTFLRLLRPPLGVSLMVTTLPRPASWSLSREQAGCLSTLPIVQIPRRHGPHARRQGGWPSARPSRSGSSATCRPSRRTTSNRRSSTTPATFRARHTTWQHPHSPRRDGLGPGRGHRRYPKCRRAVVHQHHVSPASPRWTAIPASCRARRPPFNQCGRSPAIAAT